MAKTLNGVVATFEQDNLFAASYPPAMVGQVRLTKNKGILKRGTVLAQATAGTYEILQDSMVARFILADDVDTTIEPVVGQVYKTGHFIGDALIVDADHELDSTDRTNLQNAGIFVSDGLGY